MSGRIRVRGAGAKAKALVEPDLTARAREAASEAATHERW
jgi:hypothetical protein